ncbi:MAG: hypothetical protein GF311_08445 [Candidatus Lokiarchaeota archaeon]|nr:hypothetical protein [Candidatus Lokiarchaeota archaeon]
MVEIIEVNEENIEKVGLFCKKSQKKEQGYQNKLKWIKERFKEGLKYHLLMVKERGKEFSRGFIEYIPGEFNWRGIEADGWMVIHCLWITGKAKNQGSGSKLVEVAINDAKEQNMHGVVVLTSSKCDGIANNEIFEKLNFKQIEEAKPAYELYTLQFNKDAPTPKINPTSIENIKKCGKGIVIIDAHQCPYAQTIVDPVGEWAKNQNIPFKVITYKNCKEAQQNGISPYAIYGVIYNNEVISYCYPRRGQEIIDKIKKLN